MLWCTDDGLATNFIIKHLLQMSTVSNKEQSQRHCKVLVVVKDLVVERGHNSDDSLRLLKIPLVPTVSVTYLLPETVSKVAMESVSRQKLTHYQVAHPQKVFLCQRSGQPEAVHCQDFLESLGPIWSGIPRSQAWRDRGLVRGIPSFLESVRWLT